MAEQAVEASGWKVWVMSRWTAFHAWKGGGEWLWWRGAAVTATTDEGR